jgi:hypothetical protein
MVANPAQGGSTYNRSTLYLAVYNANGSFREIYAVVSGVGNTPVYPGLNKNGGAQYPGICLDSSNNVWVSFDEQKENVYVAKIPLSSIP